MHLFDFLLDFFYHKAQIFSSFVFHSSEYCTAKPANGQIGIAQQKIGKNGIKK
jgi:hypothetical protein